MNGNFENHLTIEHMASHTWPAEYTSQLANWLIRASQGVTKRGNSVLAIGPFPEETAWMHKIEQFYKERGLPTLFHVSSASPEGLDEQLEQAGYIKDAPCLLMSACSQEVKIKH